jgi:hypothetical protein
MRPVLAILTTAALAAGLAAPALAAETTFDVPATAAKTIASVKRHTTVPVLLPDSLVTDVDKLYASGGATRRGWDISLAAAPRCGGATACFIAGFSARRATTLPGGTRVRLRGGVPGVYRPMSCGASCAPANLWFRRRGVVYQFQFQPLHAARRTMVALANQALKAGPR